MRTEGRFSEDCVRQVIPWKFVLPNVAEGYALAAFTVDNPSDPSDLLVQYEPINNDPPLRLEITHNRRAFGAGNRSLTLTNDVKLYVTPQGGSIAAYFELAGDIYSLILLTAGNPSDFDGLLVTIGDAIIAQQ